MVDARRREHDDRKVFGIAPLLIAGLAAALAGGGTALWAGVGGLAALAAGWAAGAVGTLLAAARTANLRRRPNLTASRTRRPTAT